jgi:hypothetical protein
MGGVMLENLIALVEDALSDAEVAEQFAVEARDSASLARSRADDVARTLRGVLLSLQTAEREAADG